MPNIAEVIELPPEPTGVSINITQTRIQVSWDSPMEADDGDDGTTDDEGVPTDEEISYFQVQLSTDVGFATILRFDRFHRSHAKTWRINKPGTGTYYARVRSVDDLGNKSAWVESNDAGDVPTTPVFPSITFKRQGTSDKLKAIVTTDNVAFADEDISRYQFQLREVEYTKLDGTITAGASSMKVTDYDSDEVPSPSFTAFIQDEDVLVTAIAGAQNRNWSITRAQNGTTAAEHLDGKRVYFFGSSSKAENQKVEEEPSSSQTKAVFRGCEPKIRYTARVRAIDAQNRRSAWSPWSPVIKAAAGASTGDPGVDNPTPGIEDVTSYDWPFERIIRFIEPVLEGGTSDPFSGLEATAISARAIVTNAPSAAATVHISLGIGIPEPDLVAAQHAADAFPTLTDIDLDEDFPSLAQGYGSFLTLVIPAGETMSELTFVVPPLFIGQNDGQYFNETEKVTVTQTDMNGASGTLTVYLMILLPDGTE